MANKLVSRDQWAAYYNVGNIAQPSYHLIGEGFTSFSESKNPKEYSRHYVHEKTERTDVVGYAPSISYSTDVYSENPVILDIMGVTDNELIGSDAQREIVTVNQWEELAAGVYRAYKRSYAIIPDGKGNGTDALVYTGTLKAAGDVVPGRWTAATNSFTPDAGTLGELIVDVIAGASATKTKVSDIIGEGAGTLYYKVGENLTAPYYGESSDGYTALTLNTDITCAGGDRIVVVEVVDGAVVAASSLVSVVVGA